MDMGTPVAEKPRIISNSRRFCSNFSPSDSRSRSCAPACVSTRNFLSADQPLSTGVTRRQPSLPSMPKNMMPSPPPDYSQRLREKRAMIRRTALFPSFSFCAAFSSLSKEKKRQRKVIYISRFAAVRGNGPTSRMLVMPVTYMTMRSRPSPKPACSTPPYRRKSRYH